MSRKVFCYISSSTNSHEMERKANKKLSSERAMRKRTKVRWFLRPTQVMSQRQWWSKSLQQCWHSRQCLVRSGITICKQKEQIQNPSTGLCCYSLLHTYMYMYTVLKQQNLSLLFLMSLSSHPIQFQCHTTTFPHFTT